MKSHYGECLLATGSCFECCEDDNKVTDCPTIDARGTEAKQVALNVPMDDAPNKRCF